MSNLEPDPQESPCGGTGGVAPAPVREVLEGRDVVLGGTRGLPVIRTLPNKHRRMVGAWCFVDHFGELASRTFKHFGELASRTFKHFGELASRTFKPSEGPAQGSGPMRVPPHPHTALQTVTWLIRGEVRHRDSLGSDQLIRPGQLNLMTAGQGIAHAEDSLGPGPLHGVQLWVALPGAAVSGAPAFAHHAELPSLMDGAVTTRLLVGSLDGETSPAYSYTPLVGAEVVFSAAARTVLPLEPDFEYAALTLIGGDQAGDPGQRGDGTVDVDGGALPVGPMLYLGTGRRELELRGGPGDRVLLLGGEPFAEEMIMWWNFIGRSHEEIVAAREDWMAGRRFGTVSYEGPPLPAPDLPTTQLRPRGRTR